jgi:hypothetical protein
VRGAKGFRSFPSLAAIRFCIRWRPLLPDRGPGYDAERRVVRERVAREAAVMAGGLLRAGARVGLTLPWNGGSSGWPDAMHRS